MHIRKMISFLLSAILLFCSTGNALCEEANPDYTRVGLKVTGLMSEIVDSTDFLEFQKMENGTMNITLKNISNIINRLN